MFYQGEQVWDRVARKRRVVIKIEWRDAKGKPLASPLFLLGDSVRRDWREARDVGSLAEASALALALAA